MFLFPFDLDVALRRFLNYKVRPLIHLVACPVQYLRVPGDSWLGPVDLLVRKAHMLEMIPH